MRNNGEYENNGNVIEVEEDSLWGFTWFGMGGEFAAVSSARSAN